MPSFLFRAKDGPQKVIEGSIEAESLDAALGKIIAQGYSPLDVKPRAMKLAGRTATPSPVPGRRVPFHHITHFTRQLSDLVDAGVPILRALALIEKQIHHVRFQKIIKNIKTAVQNGQNLSTALMDYPGTFSPLFVNMVAAGEMSGKLNVVLLHLADYMEKDHELRQQIKTSLIYPTAILIVGVLTITFLVTKVVPQIIPIFEDMETTLPLPTMMLIAISDFLGRWWWALFLSLVSLAVLIRQALQRPRGKIWMDRLKLQIVGIRTFTKDVETARFARTMGLLLENGVVIVAALRSVIGAIGNQIFKDSVRQIGQDVKNGASLAEAMTACDLFPDVVVSMVAVGEETGKTYRSLNKLADYYERTVRQTIKSFTSLIEPGLIITLGVTVGFIVVAMLVPIFRMNLMIR